MIPQEADQTRIEYGFPVVLQICSQMTNSKLGLPVAWHAKLVKTVKTRKEEPQADNP